MKKPGIIQDSTTGMFYGHLSEFPHQYDFIEALNEGSKTPWNLNGDEFTTLDVTQVYARYCVAKCDWHEHDLPDGFWHIEYKPGRGRTPAWQYGTP